MRKDWLHWLLLAAMIFGILAALGSTLAFSIALHTLYTGGAPI